MECHKSERAEIGWGRLDSTEVNWLGRNEHLVARMCQAGMVCGGLRFRASTVVLLIPSYLQLHSHSFPT